LTGIRERVQLVGPENWLIFRPRQAAKSSLCSSVIIITLIISSLWRHRLCAGLDHTVHSFRLPDIVSSSMLQYPFSDSGKCLIDCIKGWDSCHVIAPHPPHLILEIRSLGNRSRHRTHFEQLQGSKCTTALFWGRGFPLTHGAVYPVCMANACKNREKSTSTSQWGSNCSFEDPTRFRFWGYNWFDGSTDCFLTSCNEKNLVLYSFSTPSFGDSR